MALKISYDKLEDVPSKHIDLYVEKEGKYVLTGIEGLKTQTDIDALTTSLNKERLEHKKTKEKFKSFDGMDIEDIQKNQDELTDLRARVEAHGKDDTEKLSKLVEAGVARQVAPIKRDLDKAIAEKNTLAADKEGLLGTLTKKTIETEIRRSAETNKVVSSAIDDVVAIAGNIFHVGEDGHVVTKDNVGVTPGIAPDAWLTDMKDKRQHWWPASQGGGATGGKDGGVNMSENPFSQAGWNLTKQGQIVRQDRTKAEQLAKLAGTSIGGPMPIKKSA